MKRRMKDRKEANAASAAITKQPANVTYQRVRKHHSKEERRRSGARVEGGRWKGEAMVVPRARAVSGGLMGGFGSAEASARGVSVRRRKKERRMMKRRKWTLNRSPHGNKTAREQRGREEWKLSMQRQALVESAGVEGGSSRSEATMQVALKERRNGKVGVTKRRRRE